jgi:PAS domain S-box-containing protein
MTTTAEVTPTATSASDGVVGPPCEPKHWATVNQVVALAALLGAAAVAVAFTFADATSAYFTLTWLPDGALLLGLVALTCVAELVAVRMRHEDGAVEELTLLDGVVLLNTLLLPLQDAVVVSLGGIALAYVVRRRDRVKAIYNLGVYATATTLAAALVHFISPAHGTFGFPLLAALVAGTTVFVAINLVHMALLLNALSGVQPWQVVREDAALSVLTIVGTIGFAGTALVMAVTAPLLLPCTVLPAAAIWYAYGVSASKYEERRRSARVLEYSQVLATGPSRASAIEALLELLHKEFEAAAIAILHNGTVLEFDPENSTLLSRAMAEDDRDLLAFSELALVETASLPSGWHSGMVAPVIMDGQAIGAVAIGTTGRSRLKPRDLTTVSPLVGSLAVALQNADYTAQLVEETAKLRAVVDQASDGIVVLGRHSAVEVWSPAMQRITGIAPDHALGRSLNELLDTEDTTDATNDLLNESLNRLSVDSPRVEVDVQLVRPDSERRAVRFSHAAAFADGAMVRDVVMVHDLTAERQVQRMKTDFIATVSHELRTPLTPIKGYADMLRKRGDSMTPEKRDRALGVIVDRVEHLGRLVEDLLVASSVTADGTPTHPMSTDTADLAALILRTCEDFTTAGGRVRLEISEGSIPVTCDTTRTVQVATNLISNALKYSPSDSEVWVSIDSADGTARLTVTDHGHGIPSDQLDRIFDKFHRVEDPMVMSTGGTGLGLYIARQLARAMGGDITVESTFGVGSCFTFTLPQP